MSMSPGNLKAGKIQSIDDPVFKHDECMCGYRFKNIFLGIFTTNDNFAPTATQS